MSLLGAQGHAPSRTPKRPHLVLELPDLFLPLFLPGQALDQGFTRFRQFGGEPLVLDRQRLPSGVPVGRQLARLVRDLAVKFLELLPLLMEPGELLLLSLVGGLQRPELLLLSPVSGLEHLLLMAQDVVRFTQLFAIRHQSLPFRRPALLGGTEGVQVPLQLVLAGQAPVQLGLLPPQVPGPGLAEGPPPRPRPLAPPQQVPR